MRLLASLIFILLLPACKHPLAIVGEGDIVDISGNGFGCTLEQYQDSNPVCIDNDIQGNYFTIYSAVPRLGWRFDYWEGSCGHLSVPPECRFDVSAGWVAFWDKDFSAFAIPPLTAVFSKSALPTGPPYAGTISIDPDIVLPSDPSAFTDIAYLGRGERWMFDRRVNDWRFNNAFLFNASYSDGSSVEVQVNPEFGDETQAQTEAEKYAWYAGQLPAALRRDLETMWIHLGLEPFGGGNNNLLIHTAQADAYLAEGILEETLIHEASHTSLDADHAGSAGWLQAQATDPTYISTYARDFPGREDVAESFLPYFAIRYRADRISESTRLKILDAIPNRIDYFDQQSFPMFPAAP